MSDRYIIKSQGGSPVPCLTERQALQKAAELFDTYGPDAEIYQNELSAESILYSREWMRQWNGLQSGKEEAHGRCSGRKDMHAL